MSLVGIEPGTFSMTVYCLNHYTMEFDDRISHFPSLYFAHCKNQLTIEKKLPPLKPILALPTWGQICFVLEAEPFEITNFDLGHPVAHLLLYKMI